MIIFGGILELTKELNEMLLFEFKTENFYQIGNDSHVDQFNEYHTSAKRNEEVTDSPLVRRQT